MGVRCHLNLYLEEKAFEKEEIEYYKLFLKQYDDSLEKEDELKKKAKEIQHIWNENFTMTRVGNSLPSCRKLVFKEKTFYHPDFIYSKFWDKVSFDCKNVIPKEFLVLFSKNEYITTETIEDITYSCYKLITSKEKALTRISSANINSCLFKGLISTLNSINEEIILELDFGKMIINEGDTILSLYPDISAEKMENHINSYIENILKKTEQS